MTTKTLRMGYGCLLRPLLARPSHTQRWEPLARQKAQALALAPAQPITLAPELTPSAPVVNPDVTDLDRPLLARPSHTQRWEPLARQKAQALALAPAQPITLAPELTPSAPVVNPDVTDLDVSIVEKDHDPSFRSSPYLP
ncbi:UNVERIFIED_CONTAM: hypothetical protein FKN15_001507 [Acipenser sinensis]